MQSGREGELPTPALALLWILLSVTVLLLLAFPVRGATRFASVGWVTVGCVVDCVAGRFDWTMLREVGVGVLGEGEVAGCDTGAFTPGVVVEFEFVGVDGFALEVDGGLGAGAAGPVD